MFEVVLVLVGAAVGWCGEYARRAIIAHGEELEKEAKATKRRQTALKAAEKRRARAIEKQATQASTQSSNGAAGEAQWHA